MSTIPSLLAARAKGTPYRPFLLFEGREVTYQELDERSTRVASALVRRGVRPGDNVLVLMDNRPDFLFAWFGILKAGAAIVPVNPAFKPPEIEHIRTNSESRLVLTEAPEDAPVARPDVAADAVAAIVYTSGTTGKAKGAMLTHGNYLWDAEAIVRHARMTPDDRFLCILPLFHLNAQVVTTLAPMVAGGSMVLMRKFSPIEMLETLARTSATAFSAVPTVYGSLNNTPGASRYELSRLRFCICGAAPMPVEVFETFERTFGARIMEGYGLTEGTCVSAVNPLDRRKLGSIGRALEGQDMKLVDGEIVIRGPNVMKGYYKDPAATAQAIRDGWLHTGDLARVDEDGYFFIFGRTKDMINRGGMKVWPKEIEDVLFAHPAVLEAAVVGVPDAKYGEEVAAFIVRKVDVREPDVLAFCRERLADHKCPKSVRFVDALPKTATGKVQKHLIRD
jgi:long-chain acyl-CoA synthetase